jgi:hypothetical protein
MIRLNPDKLSVEFGDKIARTHPIIPRRYTLTHSDITAELFLTIAQKYAYDKINPNRDEVLAEWRLDEHGHYLYSSVLVDGEFGLIKAFIRNRIFIQELPLALEAIVYGDQEFFKAHPILNNSPIYVKFISSYPAFNRTEYWGKVSAYK